MSAQRRVENLIQDLCAVGSDEDAFALRQLLDELAAANARVDEIEQQKRLAARTARITRLHEVNRLRRRRAELAEHL